MEIVKNSRMSWRHVSSPPSRLWARVEQELFHEALEPILNPTPVRIFWLGLFTVVGHPLFWWVWANALPQPYENAGGRLVLAVLGIGLMVPSVYKDPSSHLTRQVFTVIFWLQLPFFFSWMYLHNTGNPVWLASVCAMILIYYHVTDWRLATMGILSGGLAAWWVSLILGTQDGTWPVQQIPVNSVVIAFCWCSALLLGLSSANLRREQLKNTLVTMGIMAHELRTPLATLSLIGEALRTESDLPGSAGALSRLGKISRRVDSITRVMNQQIDMQIANARLLQLPTYRERIVASDLVQDAISQYPYRSVREHECTRITIHKDFEFLGSKVLFVQVLHNLIKNALHSLATASSVLRAGDLRLEVITADGQGRIYVKDNGMGVPPALQARIFDPFFSTERRTGHGLGLAFCQRVVESSGGVITVKSEIDTGAAFVIELPVVAASAATHPAPLR